jgi:hypothetical protein
VPAVLAVYAWHKDQERYRRIVRMIDYLFDRFERLQKEPGYHDKWKDLNLAATVPGWTRFPALQDRLDRIAARSTPDSRMSRDRNPPAAQKVRVRVEGERCCKRRAAHAIARQGHAAIHMRPRRGKPRGPQNPLADAAFGYASFY